MRKLGIVAIVSVGLWSLVQAATFLSYSLSIVLYSGPSGTPMAAALVAGLLPFAATLALGVLLVWKRESLADWWFEDSPLDLSIDATPLLRAGLLLVGVVLGTQAVPSFLQTVSRTAMIAAQSQGEQGVALGTGQALLNSIPDIVSPVFELLFAFLLIKYSERLSEFLWASRAPVTEPETGVADLPVCPSCGTPYDPADYEGGIATPLCGECKEPLDLDGT